MYKITVPTIITNGHFNKEKTLAELKRAKAHRIALSIDRQLDFTFSSPENLKLLGELIAYYKSNGYETLVWLGETLGHGSPVNTPEKYTNIHLVSNGVPTKALCPMNENFKKDFASWICNVAKYSPDMIMLDDDFRFGLRGGSTGCCCPLHMKAFEEELGEKVDVSALPNLIFDSGENKYRKAWMKVQGDSLMNFATHMRNELDKVAPQIRLGYCTTFSAWDTDGTDAVALAKAFAGNTKPFLRTFGAPYHTNAINVKLARTVEQTRLQVHFCKNEDIEIFTEGDTYPRPRTATTPASYLECFDMILRADGSPDGILKYMLDYVSDADYETAYTDAHVRNSHIYDMISQHFDGKKCTGVRPYSQAHIFEQSTSGFNYVSSVLRSSAANLATLCSLPVSYEKGGVNIVFGENAKYIPLDDLKYGNIIDYPAALTLMERGIDVGIETAEEYAFPTAKGFTDLPSEYFPDEDCYVRLDSGPQLTNITPRAGAKILSFFKAGKDTVNGAFEYTNDQGTRFLVFPFVAESGTVCGWLDSYCRRRQVTDFVNSRKPLDAVIKGNFPGMYMMTKKDETNVAVGLWNLFPDAAYGCRISTPHPTENITFLNCEGHTENGEIVIDSVIHPYEFAGFEIKI